MLAFPQTERLVCKTGGFNTLNKISLAEDIQNDQGKNYEKTCGILYCNFKGLSVRACCFTEKVKRFGHCGPEFAARKKEAFGVGKEGVDIEDVSPLPCESKDKYRDQHRTGDGEDDFEEGLEYTVTVDERGFFKFIRNAAVVAAHKEDKQAVLERKPRQREKDQRYVGIVNTLCQAQRSVETGCFKKSENIEIDKFLNEGRSEDLVRNNHRQHNEEEDEIAAFEFKFRKAITNECCNEHLDHCTNSGKEERVEHCLEILVFRNQIFVRIERREFRDHLNVTLQEVLRAHEGCRNFREKREQNDIRNTEKKNETEDGNKQFLVEKAVQVFRLHSLLQGGSFKLNANLVLGAFQNAGCVFLIVIHIILFLPS